MYDYVNKKSAKVVIKTFPNGWELSYPTWQYQMHFGDSIRSYEEKLFTYDFKNEKIPTWNKLIEQIENSLYIDRKRDISPGF